MKDHMQYTILAADDETEILDVLELYMIKEGFSFIKASDGLQALDLFSKRDVHIVLLDIMMPGLDGFSVLRKIRETSTIPAIMLSARDADYDKILGLELGADDYISKPYNPLEVIARIKAQLRRQYAYTPSESQNSAEILYHKNLTLNLAEGTFKKDHLEIQLTSTEFRILRLFMEKPGRIYTRRQIYEFIWDDSFYGDDNTVAVHISNLRNKIETDPKRPNPLKTIKGLGYKLEK